MNKMGILYLLPTPLGERTESWLLPEDQVHIQNLTDFIVESEKTARKNLKLLNLNTPIQNLSLQLLNEHTPENKLPELLEPLIQGKSVALMSDAGCPAIADPGAHLVALAHHKKIKIHPIVGPSSIFLALMASGANGQKFTFNGYLPSEKGKRKDCLKKLENRIKDHNESQLFIETPYRNMALLVDAIEILNNQTQLCIAADLSLPSQTIISLSINNWKNLKELPDLKKRPCMFILF